jgi:hypothetical protein
LENKNLKNKNLEEILKMESNLMGAIEKWRESKKEEMIEKVKEMLMESNHQKSQEVIKEIKKLEEFKFITNMEGLKIFDEFPENLSTVNENFEEETVENDYAQIQLDYEFNENKKMIENIFEEKLLEKGFVVEDRVLGMTKIRNEGKAYYMFENIKGEKIAKQINDKIMYTSLLIAVNNFKEEEEIETEINEWLGAEAPGKKETIKKYIVLNITSKERLMGQENPIKSIKIA